MIDWKVLRDEQTPIEYRVGFAKWLGYVTRVDEDSVWIGDDDGGRTCHQWYKAEVTVLRALTDKQIPQKEEWRDVTDEVWISGMVRGSERNEYKLVRKGVDCGIVYLPCDYRLSGYRIEQKV